MRHDLVLLGRLALAVLLGFAVGWEREYRRQVAGNRTFALVSLGAAAFTTIGVDAFPPTAEKLLAGVVTGVGFIGAGIVFHAADGGARGLTTAAAVWAVSAVGVLAGAGRFVLATGCAALIVVILEMSYVPGLRALNPRRAGKHPEDGASGPPKECKK